jgi:hypothetical protein
MTGPGPSRAGWRGQPHRNTGERSGLAGCDGVTFSRVAPRLRYDLRLCGTPHAQVLAVQKTPT